MGIRAEAWTLPHIIGGTFQRKFPIPHVVSWSFLDPYSGIGSGELVIPGDFDRLDQILYVDPSNHANDVGSIIRLYQGTNHIGDFLAQRVERTWNDAVPTVTIRGQTPAWLLDRVIVRPYDDPADPSVNPDWGYGLPSVLTNGGIEENEVGSEVQFVWNNASSGTFTLTDGVDTTSAINYNADPTIVALRLETDITSIVDVSVTGAGTSTSPWTIEWLNPAGTDVSYTLTANDGGLTGGTSTTGVIKNGGTYTPSGWTKSVNLVSGLPHGVYDAGPIVASGTTHTGTYALRINSGAPRWSGDYAGAQQIVNVKPGRTYRAGVWIYNADASTRDYVLVLRTLDETYIAHTVASVPTTTWTEITIDPFVMPSHVNQLIYRVAMLEDVDVTGDWYIDDAELAIGLPTATLGEILGDLIDDANAGSRDAMAWITPTFTDALDSSGAAWDQNLTWNVKRGQSMLQLLEYAERWDYEWRLRWDTGDTRFELDVFNGGNGGTDYTAAAGPAILSKDGITGSGPLVRRMPDYVTMFAEGDQGEWGEYTDSTLLGVWGPLEEYEGNKQGRDSTNLAVFAQERVGQAAETIDALLVRQTNPTIQPWIDYQPGDTITVNLSPKLPKAGRRVTAVAARSTDTAAVAFDIHLDSLLLDPPAAESQAVANLIRRFKGLESQLQPEDIDPVESTIGSVFLGSTGYRINCYSLPGTQYVHNGVLRMIWPVDATLVGVSHTADTAPTGASHIIDINKNGTTVYTNTANRPAIAATTNASAETQPDDTSISAGDYLTVNVEQVGSTNPGANVVVTIRWTEVAS